MAVSCSNDYVVVATVPYYRAALDRVTYFPILTAYLRRVSQIPLDSRVLCHIGAHAERALMLCGPWLHSALQHNRTLSSPGGGWPHPIFAAYLLTTAVADTAHNLAFRDATMGMRGG